MSADSIKASGHVKIITMRNGRIISQWEGSNLIVNVGKEYIAAKINGESVGDMAYVGVGSNQSVPVISDTALGNEVIRKVATKQRSGNTIQFQITLLPTEAVGSISEAGIFNAPNGGTMLARIVFAPIVRSSSDTSQIFWSITFR